ncbi:hypothetical protein OIU77_008662 [Salix suchowensis]|uniref:Uncharacterized protein n=1 Tax=Salix suchowensis TaxID=1278906 RepID=A0ABQ9ABN4_9ROSI|nr:hypothetical protein OIU77_008662 [Salix suchowensis]
MASDTKRGSVSRLSPLAKPFILNTPKNSSSALNPSLQDTSLSPSSSRLAQSFSSFRVEGDSFSCYSLYPSRVYQSSDDFGLFTESKSDLDALLESKSAELGYKAHKSGDHQEILHWKDNHGGLSMSNDDSTKQGHEIGLVVSVNDSNNFNPEENLICCWVALGHKLFILSAGSPTEGLKLRAETSDHVCRKFSGISRNDEVRPNTIRQIETQHVSFSAVKSRPISSKFSTPSDLHSSSLVQDPQSGVPAIYWSSNDSDLSYSERRFSQQLNACTDKVHVSPSSDDIPLRALDPNLDSDGHGGVRKNGMFCYSLDSLIDADVNKSKEVLHDKVLTDKSKGKMSKPVTQEVTEPLSMAKSELRITCPGHRIELSSKSFGVKDSDPFGNSSEITNEKDSDLDSPCWKGKHIANQSTCEVSGPDNFQHLKSARAACSNLNPLAPHFFPSSGKQKLNYRGTECEGDDCLTFQKTESPAVCLFSTEQTLKKTFTAGSSSSDHSSITETHCSIDMPVPNKEYELLTSSSSIPMLNSSCVVQPSIMEDYLTSNGQLLTGQKIVGSGKVIEDAVPNGSSSVSFLASEHVKPKSTRQMDTQHFKILIVEFQQYLGAPMILTLLVLKEDFQSNSMFVQPKGMLPPSSDSNPLCALESVSLGAGTSYSPYNHAWSQNLDSDGHVGVSKNDTFWYNLDSLIDRRATVDKSKEFCHGEVLIDKSKEVFHGEVLIDKSKRKMSKPVTQEVMEPLSMEKSEPQITCPSRPLELSSKSFGVKDSDPFGNSSEITNENDFDLDSPCWKGKLRADQSTCEVFRPDNFQHLKSAQASCSNLNPLAPHFFPSCGKQKVNYRGTECEGDDCLTFQKSESAAVCLFSTEQTLKKTVTAGSSSSDQSSITETHCSIDMPVPNKEYELLTNSSSIPMLNSSCVVQPTIMEDYFTSNGQLLTGQKIVGSGKVIEDAVPNGSTSLSLLASEHVISSSSHRVGVSSALSETHGLVTKPLCTPPKLDIQIVVKTMSQMSELLMQNCTNDSDSLNEHEHDIMKRIVYNLNACIGKRVREHALTSESIHPRNSYRAMKSADLSKFPMSLAIRIKHEEQTSSTDLRDRFLDSLSSLRRRWKGIKQLKEEENPRVMVYENSWLDAEAALCSMKYKACVLGMKTEMGQVKMAVR